MEADNFLTHNADRCGSTGNKKKKEKEMELGANQKKNYLKKLKVQ